MKTLLNKTLGLMRVFFAETSVIFSSSFNWTRSIDFPFLRTSIAQFHLEMLKNDTLAPKHATDTQTWNDLLLDQYFDSIAGELSIFGQQMLFHRLKVGLDDQACETLTERLRQLQEHPQMIDELLHDCRRLRECDTEVAGFLFAGKYVVALPSWAKWLGLFIYLLPISLGLTILTPFAWIGVAAAFALLLLIQASYHNEIIHWEAHMKTLQLMLRCVSLLGVRAEKKDDFEQRIVANFSDLSERSGKVNRMLTNSPAVDAISAAREYNNWFALGNVRHYFKSVETVALHHAFLCECFLAIANLEADLALVRHLRKTPLHCWVERSGISELEIQGFVHPLLENVDPLTLTLENSGAFISGKNGIGKSTLLRSVGLNMVCARAFGFCYAINARLPNLPVYASMQNEDSLLAGESLYISELRRARELLTSSEGANCGIYLIDEIFRGTNHLESIAAATAVIETLAKRAIVIVSSHNLVLASLLKDYLLPLCVSHQDSADFSRKILILKSGVLADTNGISLLGVHGFSAEIGTRAAQVSQQLAEFFITPK
jgi:hypothetical protein